MDRSKVGKVWSQFCVKENPATYLIADAEYAFESARSAKARQDEQAATRFSRVAILLYAVSLEAYVNFVYEYSEVPNATWRNLTFKDKWLKAAPLCLPQNGVLITDAGVVYRPGDPIDRFQEDSEPFVSFLELKSFRDNAVHLKPPFADFVNVEREEIDAHLSREEYYPISGLPKLLQHCRLEHAEAARRIYQAMIGELDRQMKGELMALFRSEGGAWVESMDDSYDEDDEGRAGGLPFTPFAKG